MRKTHACIARYCALPLVAAFAAMVSLADSITWEGTTNLTMTAATTVEVPAGTTSVIEELSGAYALTKTGGGTLEIRYVKTASASVVVAEGRVRFANPRPDDIFAKAYFHVDASDTSTMTIETVNGTNFVTRWNDVDGRTERYATLCLTEYTWRDNPQNRKPFLREGFQNGLPVVDFGSLVCRQLTNAFGRALGHGAAMTFDRTSPCIKEGFTVASDVDRVSELKKLSIWTKDIYGMSYFSHETSYCFVRASGAYAGSDGWGIMHGNANNNDYFATGKSVWYDGTLITGSPNGTHPTAGFHIVRIHPTTDSASHTVFRNFAAEYISNTPSRSYGGQRIAEYVLFTNKTETGESAMTTNEVTAVNRYLRVKWFPQSISAVTVARGASLDVDPSSNLAIKSLADEGATDLVLAHAATNRTPIIGALVHLDASRADTMTITSQNGTNFVSRWNDADGGANYAVSEDTTGAGGQRRNPENRLPFISVVTNLNSHPFIDLGSAMFRDVTNETGAALGYGAAFRFAGFPDLKVAEYLSVISDTEDLKTARAGQYGPCYTSYRSKASSFDGYNPGRRGQTVAGKNPPLFYKVSSSGNATCVNGTHYVNGVNRAYTYNPPDGFNIINIRPTSAISCNLIGRHVRNAGSNRADTYGGQRIAEYMIFGELLGEEKRDRIYKAMRTKWFGDAPATTNYYNCVTLGAKALMAVGNGGEALSVTNTLTLAGTVEAVCVSARNLAATSADAAVNGALTLPDGATLSFEQLPDGTWTSLSATSLAAEGAVTVTLSSADAAEFAAGTSVRLIATDAPPASLGGWTVRLPTSRRGARLSVRDDGVWAEFFRIGTILFVK